MLKDFVYAARTLRANPAFTAAAVLTLALGIGASTAIFSVANAVLLRPLPYKDPGRLIYACADLKTRNVSDHLWSGPDYMDLRDHASATLEDVAAVSTGRFNLAHDDGSPEEVVFASVTPNIFRLLGARIVMGRDFIDTDGQTDPGTADGAPPPPDQRLPIYAIASQEFFQRRFGGNPAALGQPIAKNGPILVGVVQRGTELLFRPDRDIERRPDLWLSLRLNYSAQRVAIFLRLIGRLRSGATIQRAQAQADAVAAQTRAIEPAYRGAGLQFRLEPMQPYLVAQVRPAILALMGAVVFLLLIACSNVANLFLVRASLRGRDLAVRTAMGASWWRLARQMLAEALLVSAAGSALGFALAWAGVHELLSVAPANLPRLDATRIDPAVLVFSMAAGLAAAVLFGLVPALRAARPDVAQVLRASGRTSGLSGGALLRNVVVVAEVALCFVLLVGSGLMFRSFLALQRTNTGYDPHNLLTFRTMGGTLARTNRPEERGAIIRQRQQALAALPGVESVTAANTLPLNGSFFPYRWGKEDALNDFSKFQSADTEIVLPGFFESMRIPLVAGRTFTDADNRPDVRHMIIDSAFAAKAFPNQNARGAASPQPHEHAHLGVVRSDWRSGAPAYDHAGGAGARADVPDQRVLQRQRAGVGRPHEGRRGEIRRARARGHGEAGPRPVVDGHPDHGFHLGARAKRYAILPAADCRVCRNRGTAGGRGPVRRVVHGSPAEDRRNRRAHGARRRAFRNLRPHDRLRIASRRDRRGGGAAGRMDAHAGHDQHAGGDQGDRSPHICRHGGPLLLHCGASYVDPGAPRGRPGPFRRAAPGIA